MNVFRKTYILSSDILVYLTFQSRLSFLVLSFFFLLSLSLLPEINTKSNNKNDILLIHDTSKYIAVYIAYCKIKQNELYKKIGKPCH